MSGNVWNWFWDMSDWLMTPYPTGVHNNPTGPKSGFGRVLRGDSWNGTATVSDVSCRHVDVAPYSYGNRGFRLSGRIL